MNEWLWVLTRLAFHLTITILIIRFASSVRHRNKSDLFTFLSLSLLIFLLLSLLRSTELGVPLSLGIFSLLSILRYRTEPVPIKQMSTLFIVMALAFINALLMTSSNVALIVLLNLIVVLLVYVIERGWGFSYESKIVIRYEKIELIKSEQALRAPEHSLLMADLRQRTGLNIKRYEIGTIDFLRDTAQITIYVDEAVERTNERLRTL